MQQSTKILIEIFIGFTIWLIYVKLKTSKKGEGGSVKKVKADRNNYMNLRNMSLSASPEKLNLLLPEDEIVVYGVVMDWYFEGVVVTVVAFQTGDASIYFSSGTIMIGGYAHQTISDASKNFVLIAQSYLTKSEKAISTQGPGMDSTRFYFKTNKGLYFHEEPNSTFTQKTNEWAGLFYAAQNLITQYRLIEQKSKVNQ